MSVPIDAITELMLTEGDAGEEQMLANIEGEGEEEEGQGPLSEEEILEIVAAELSQASTGAFNTEIDGNREDSLDYYLGNPRGDEEDGRSQIVSTDVADAVEWILPQIIKALVAKGPVVEFDAVSEQDEAQAELETEFTHDVFMKENEGFLNLYEFVKDALLQKNGIFKIYYDETDKVKTERYDGLNEQQFNMLASMPEVEVLGVMRELDQPRMQAMQQQMGQFQQQIQSMPPQQQQQAIQQLGMMGQQLQTNPPMLISCEISVTHTKGKINVDCVAPEDFRVNQHHDSLSLDKARFSAHVRLRTKSDLIEDGYDEDIINNASDNTSDPDGKSKRFSAQGEAVVSDPNYSEDESQTLLEVAECYMMIDVERSGVAQLMQITTLGVDEPTDILELTPCEENPFVSSSCIIMAHKFYGLSIYDRLKQLQDQKTSLWRNILDNLYLQNNREKEVVESQVNIDDLLVSRPGGIKRVKAPGMIRELEVQPIGQEGYQMLDYLDQVRTGRVGVSPDTAGQVDALGTAVGSEGVARLMTAKEELTGLMVRVIAETGMKGAYVKIRDMLVRYKDSTTAFKFKGEWAEVNPSQWGERSRTTVTVGTGTGDDQRKVGAIQQVIAYQSQLMADPRNTMVDQEQVYESMDEFCRVSGLTSASPYFLDPRGTEGQQKGDQKQKSDAEQKQKQEQLEKMMAEAQAMLGKAEVMKGQAALQSQQAKVQIEQAKNQLTGHKQQSENEKAALQLQLEHTKTELSALKDGQKQVYDYAKLQQEEALKLTEMELTHQRELNAQYEANKDATEE